MTLDSVKKHLITMKLHVDQMHEWMMQAMDMIYEIENKIFDIEDEMIKKNAAPKEHPLLDSPPRLSSHCTEKNIGVQALIQEFSYLNQLISK